MSNPKWLLPIKEGDDLPDYKAPVELDDLDRAILEMHQKDVFFSYQELADKWGVTAATIRNRIRQLKEEGVMDMILVLNPYKIGYEVLSVIGISIGGSATLDEAVEHLRSIPGLFSLVLVTGRFDIFAWYLCRNLEEYRRLVDKELRDVPGIERFESFMGLDLYAPKFGVGVLPRSTE